MATDTALFFDTYALIEIIQGNPNYRKCMDFEIVTAKLNIFELYYRILKEKGTGQAQYYCGIYWPFVQEFDADAVSLAAKLKLLNKNLSMTDCIGYAIARKLGIKFLTGDNEFKNMPNVEFVK